MMLIIVSESQAQYSYYTVIIKIANMYQMLTACQEMFKALSIFLLTQLFFKTTIKRRH